MGFQKEDKAVTPPPPPVQPSPFFAPDPLFNLHEGEQGGTFSPQSAGVFAGPGKKTGEQGKKGGAGNAQGVVGAAGSLKEGSPAAAKAGDADILDAEQREYVKSALDSIKAAAEIYKVAKIDQATFERVLSNWLVMEPVLESRIGQMHPGGAAGTAGDPALLYETRRSFGAAIRSLFTRASSQLGKPLIRLYLENSYRLPYWAWPDSGIFMGGKEKDKRGFADDFAKALQDLSLFDKYSTLDQSSLIDILVRLRTLVDDSQVMIAGQLGNDSDLRKNLRDAYRGALEALLKRASIQMGTNIFSLYIRFRYNFPLIHPWGDRLFGGITAPIPLGVTAPDPLNGEVSFVLNGFQVVIAPDGTQKDDGAMTQGRLPPPDIPYDSPTGTVSKFGPAPLPVMTIHTDYGPGANSGATSGYGRGTTDEDTRHGDSSLGFHEGNHAIDYIHFIAANPAPVFGGKVGDSTTAFERAKATYYAELINYVSKMSGQSAQLTDCVGKPNIISFFKGEGKVPPVTCK